MRDVTCPEWSFDGAKMLEPVSSVYQGNPRLLGCGGARSRRNEASERIGHLRTRAHVGTAREVSSGRRTRSERRMGTARVTHKDG
mmetsp:Transcript_13626/g.40387  ORF Transcript_13626/g.40387 Transcript_13626/m.40387 type:complete len:85 (+) Transcript_13626:289-543(+)